MAALTLTSPKTNRQLKPLVEAALDNELHLLEAGLHRTETRLNMFQEKYSLSTLDFLSRYENDELEESDDFAEWIGEIRLRERLREKMETLRSIRFED